MERKIGEIFKHNDEWYQCLKSPDGGCKHCDMDFEKCPIPIKECTESDRSDNSYVIFKKLEKVGEPFKYSGLDDRIVMLQSYKMLTIPYISGVVCYIHYDTNIIDIEIKQTKEDMEESVEEKLFCDKVAKANAEYMKIKLNSSLKPFDIEAAKLGKPVCTRDGRKTRIICFDLKNEEYPIVAAIGNDSSETLLCYTINGEIVKGNYKSDKDLMMLPEKREGWVNVYNSLGVITFSHNPFDTKEEALATEMEFPHKNYVDTVKIEWYE